MFPAETCQWNQKRLSFYLMLHALLFREHMPEHWVVPLWCHKDRWHLTGMSPRAMTGCLFFCRELTHNVFVLKREGEKRLPVLPLPYYFCPSPSPLVEVAHQFQYAVRVIGSNYAPTIERDEFLVSEKIKKECECRQSKDKVAQPLLSRVNNRLFSLLSSIRASAGISHRLMLLMIHIFIFISLPHKALGLSVLSELQNLTLRPRVLTRWCWEASFHVGNGLFYSEIWPCAEGDGGFLQLPRLKEIRFLKDSLVKASFISNVSGLCAPQNRAGCILSVCRLLRRVLISLHPCLLLPFINPFGDWLSLFVKRLGVNKSRRGARVFPPARNESERPLGGLLFFWNCSCCRCSAQAEEGGGRCSLLGAAQEAADAGRCGRVTWRRYWCRCPAAVICFFFSAFPVPSECPEAPLVRALPAAEPRRGPSQTVQQGEKQPANYSL